MLSHGSVPTRAMLPALVHLWALGTATPAQVGSAIGITPQYAAGLLRRMEARGIAQRHAAGAGSAYTAAYGREELTWSS